MSAVLIVVPVFALIAAGYAAVALRFISPTAHKGISEFAFSIAIPALLFRIVVVAEFPAVNAFAVWGAYYGATAATWIVALLASSVLRQSRADGAVLAIGSIYGNIVMLGLPLTLSALGSQAAGSMALILSVNTPLLWLCGTLQMAWAERKSSESAPLLVLRAVRGRPALAQAAAERVADAARESLADRDPYRHPALEHPPRRTESSTRRIGAAAVVSPSSAFGDRDED